ncbi:MAG TPA: LssY C-terminal domain-containing protein [Bryobacteraceae bacterium]|nr:LssY C-terminal domain-containing protein [Bryobacteraceae bacterium]
MKPKLLFAALACLAPLRSAVLPNGSELEIRLLDPVGSRVSHVGDPVRAAVVTPVFGRDRILVPAGATVSGVIDHLDRLGLGLRHTAARLDLQFTELHLSDRTVTPIHARLVSVEEAREIVNDTGVVVGIHPEASFSTAVSGAFTLFFIGEPEFRLAVLGFKFLAARSPDAEIAFPAGTEMLLRLTDDVLLNSLETYKPAVPPLTTPQDAHFEDMLAGLPEQQTNRDHRHASDLINIVLIGNQQAVERAFGAAGWHGSEPHSIMALYHVYHCMVQRVGYSRAPMTSLKFNGSPPDMAFQKSLDTLAKRHHIRLWREAESDVWLGAASEDIKYKLRALHITHGTDRDIDNERAKVVNDLAFTGCIYRGSLISRGASFKTVREDAHSIFTDGDVAVVQLNACEDPRLTPADPKTPQPVRAIRAARAVIEDIARSNPVSVGYGMITSIFASSKTRAGTRVQESGAYTRAIAISNVSETAKVSALR